MLALATWTLWVTAYGGGEPLRYSHLNLPFHGTVCKGKLYGFFGEKKSDASIYAIPLSDFTRKQWKNYKHRLWRNTFPLSPQHQEWLPMVRCWTRRHKSDPIR